MIPVYIPSIKKYTNSALKAINENWISNYGFNVQNAERLFANILGVKYCILMNNGTSATHCLLISLKYKYPNINKIYIPNNVFVAVWNCVLMEYDESQIEVMKMNEDTLNIDTDEEYIKYLDSNSCVFIVHNLGNVVNVPRLKQLRPDLIFIEDNCEGVFGKYDSDTSQQIYTGTFEGSLCSSVSFYANKTITTGEGGAFLTNDKEIYNFIKKSYSHGMTEQRFIHDQLAYNYRMTNIQAGFLYDQLLDLDSILKRKKQIFEQYDTLFESLIESKKIIKIKTEKNTESANWMYCIIVKNLNYYEFEEYMKQKDVEIRPLFYDIRYHKHLKDFKVKYEECRNSTQGVMLPSYPDLELKDQEYIATCLKSFIHEKIV